MLDALSDSIVDAKVLNDGKALTAYNVNGKLFFDLSGVTRDPLDTVIEVTLQNSGAYPARAASTPPPVLENLVKKAKDAGQLTGSVPNYYNDTATYNWDKACDGDMGSRWASKAGTRASALELTFANPVTVNKGMVSSYGVRVQGFNIEYWDATVNGGAGNWVVAATYSGPGASDGAQQTFAFDTFTSTKVRLNITHANGDPSIYEFQLYYDAAVDSGANVSYTSPAAGKKIDGDFTVSGKYRKGYSIELKISAPELYDTVSLSPTLNTVDGTWSVYVDTSPWPGYIENLSFLALLKDGSGKYVAVKELQAVYGGYENLALGLGAPAYTASTSGNPVAGIPLTPDMAFDGVSSTSSRWGPSSTDTAPWLQVDFGKPTVFNKVVMSVWETEARVKRFEIWYDDGDGNWTVGYSGDEMAKGETGHFMLPEPVTASRVRIVFTENLFDETTGKWPVIQEVEVYNMPTDFTKLRTAYTKAETEIGLAEVAGSFPDMLPNADVEYYDAVTAAKNVLEQYMTTLPADQEPTQRTVDAALKALNNAIAALKGAPRISGGTSAYTLTEGYAAYSTSPFAIAGKGTVDVSVSSFPKTDKIIWNNTTKTIDVASGLTEGTYGKYIVTLKASNGTSPDSIFVFTLTVNAASSAATLSAPETIGTGKEFVVNLGLKNIPESETSKVYAEDITISFDENLFEFVSVEGVNGNIMVTGEPVVKPGSVRILVSNVGGISGDAELLKLTFKAKAINSEATGHIAISKAELGMAPDEMVIQLDPVRISITVTAMFGDVNKDGVVDIKDLALASSYYLMKEGEAGWDKAKRADFNDDGEIGIEDLVIVANEILK